MKKVVKRIVLHFPRNLIDQPIVCKLVNDFDLMFNILQARVTPNEEGLMILELEGRQKDYARGIKYLQEQGVKVQLLSKDIKLQREKHCSTRRLPGLV